MITKLIHGLIPLPWWGYLLLTLALTHLTILSVSLYLHRCQTHRSVELHPVLSHFFRFWLWLTTGMVTKEWVAVHRKHHAYVDKAGDPHSPAIFGIKRVLATGAELYQTAANDQEILNKYGRFTPEDWLEVNLYAKYDKLGVILMLIINLALFGALGLAIWAFQMLWIPLTAAGIINGLGHYRRGYRNFGTNDNSTNIVPFGILLCGEELHNNHHAFISSCKFSVRKYEIDLGWAWIKLLSFLHLAKIKRSLPDLRPMSNNHKSMFNKHTLKTLISYNPIIIMQFTDYIRQEYSREIKNLKFSYLNLPNWQQIHKILMKDKLILNHSEQLIIAQLSKHSLILNTIFNLRYELAELWQNKALSQDQLIRFFKIWCYKAETCEISSLQHFVAHLKSCSFNATN